MNKASILVIEDDKSFVPHLQGILSQLKYTIAATVASIEEAMRFLAANPVDMILMDIERHGAVKGLSIAKNITEVSDLPVVLLAGSSEVTFPEPAKIAEPYGYLAKPLDKQELATTIEIALYRHMLDSKLKESQRALQKSEAKHRHLFENAPLGIFRVSLDGKALAVNLQMAKIVGCETVEEAVEEFTDLANQFYTDPNRRLEFLSLLRAKGSVDHFEYEGVKKNGEKIWVSMNARLTSADNGQTGEMVIDGFAFDITARKLAEDALRESEKRLKLAVSSSPIPIMIHDEEDRILQLSDGWTKLSGYTLEDIPTLGDWTQLAYGERKGGSKEYIDNLFNIQQTVNNGEWQVTAKDGSTRIWNFQTTPLGKVNAGKRVLVSMATDITEQKHAEKERKNLQIQLIQAQKMEAIGTLAGGIAHDFNNILGAIIGYAEMAREDCSPVSSTAKDLDQVLKAGLRAKDLVKQILAFSRQTETERIPMQISVITKEAIKLLRSSLPTTITIEQDIDPATNLIQADPIQIHQIIINLATNAFHAMEETGGTLTFSVRNKTLSQQNLVGIAHSLPGNFVELSIADTGSGITPEIQARIFDPYFTTKETGKGTGMGLAIVHGIVKSCGGFINCDSQVEKGTTFHVYLPALKGDAAPDPKLITIVPEGTEHILFIDDESMLVEMAQDMLRRLGYSVTVRTNSLDALTAFRNQPEIFDLVITDQTMPGMTGMELARRMLQIRPDLPIILCTGYSSLISEEKALFAGIRGFALKPLVRNDLAAVIRQVLDRTNQTEKQLKTDN